MFYKKGTRKQRGESIGTYNELKERVNQILLGMLRENPYEKLMERDVKKSLVQFRKDFRSAMKRCMIGDCNAKIYIRDIIQEILCSKLKITEENIDNYIPFRTSSKLSAMEKFEILLYCYEREYGKDAFAKWMIEYQLQEPKYDKDGQAYYEITQDDVDKAYKACPKVYLSFVDKVCILAQRIYQETKGNGAIDVLKEMRVDGISAGVSGGSTNCVWVFFQGKSVCLSFLLFSSEKELIRICKNIYRYQNPGQLSEVRGYIVNEMMDGSRVSVTRPPFCESWAFFIRKFDTVCQRDMEGLINDKNNIYPIGLISWLIKGCQIVAITGEQGSGKTSLLMSMIRDIRPSYNLRIQEQAFELHLRKLYPERNIVSFRETGHINAQEGIDFAKKTDGTVNILGEVSSQEVCAKLIQMAQVASRFTLFTHHAKTTEDLLFYFRNSLLIHGGFTNESIALKQVVKVLRFDVHMHKAQDGHRYIERISEVIPCHEGRGYEIRNLLVYNNGTYEIQSPLSRLAIEDIKRMLSKEERNAFERDLCWWGIKKEEMAYQ